MIVLSTCFLLCLHLATVHSLNILTVTTLGSPSHHIFVDNLLLSLVDKGHNVTLFGFEADKHHRANYTFIQMADLYEKLQDDYDYLEFRKYSSWQNIQLFWSFLSDTCKLCFKTNGMRQLMEYPTDYKFDIILWDILSGPCMYPLIEKFGNPPVIGINAFVMQPNIFGNVYQGFVPFMSHMANNEPSLYERLENNLRWAAMEITRDLYFLPEQTELAKSYFGNNIIPLKEVERNISILLTNYNPVLNFVRALPPNIIPIGGIHIKSKKIPQDILQILDNAKNGVICFSLGTNIKSSAIGDEKIRAFLNVFKKLKQTVFWKFELEHLDNVPKNVFIRKWLPLSAMLEHPNTKLFIFHGGMLSFHESVYYGVPIVIIPFLLDQFKNAGTIMSRGIGEKILFDDLNEDVIYTTINKVLHNKNYTENAKKLSILYKDYPLTPLERGTFWIEYVHRHGGAHHFDIATRNMNFIQNANIDVILTFLMIIITCIFLIFYIMKLLVYYFISIFNNTAKTDKKGKLE